MTPLVAALLAVASLATAEPGSKDCSPWNYTTREYSLRECGGVPEKALEYAHSCMRLFGDKLSSRSHVIIGDWTVSGEFVRLYVLRWNQDSPRDSVSLLRSGLAHGAGNFPEKTGTPEFVQDKWNSYATPGGCMRLFGTGDAGIMSTAPDMRAFRLAGLEERNACVQERGLYFHEYPGRVDTTRRDFGDIEPGKHLVFGTSNGCVSLSGEDFDYVKKAGVIPKTGGILFVSWDGNATGAAPVAVAEKKRDCRDPKQGVWSRVVPTANGYDEAMKKNALEKKVKAATAGWETGWGMRVEEAASR